jgi:DNA-binding CsgD family transcriptional regulator
MLHNAVNFSSITDWNQTNEIIAKQLGCCEKTVTKFRRKLGLPRAPDKTTRTRLKEQLPQISDRAWETHSNWAISKILKCSESAVQVYRLHNFKPRFKK